MYFLKVIPSQIKAQAFIPSGVWENKMDEETIGTAKDISHTKRTFHMDIMIPWPMRYIITSI